VLSSAALSSGKTCFVDNIRLLEGASVRLKNKSWSVGTRGSNGPGPMICYA